MTAGAAAITKGRGRGRCSPRLVLLLLSVVGLPLIVTSAAAGMRVVATTSDLASLAEAITGDLAQVETIIPPAADPEAFEPRPSDLAKLKGASIVVRVGLGYDIHPFGDEGTLVLGGVALDGPGLAGHSDGDVVAHAVADALLGPAGLPDLGTLFPASDDRYRDVSSLELLRDVARRVAGTGWWVVNVDVVIAAERPRLAPHMEAIEVHQRVQRA